MTIHYFEDTDTMLVELHQGEAAETRELSEDVYLDLDGEGHVVGITIEHASLRGDLSEIRFRREPAGTQRNAPALGTPAA